MGSIFYRNSQKCKACGGKCCKIYTSPEQGGTYPEGQVWFEEYVAEFHENSDRYSVEPLFDPLDVHLTGNEHLKDELRDKGINPYACQYLGKEGCLIPWAERPEHCKSYKCDLLDCNDIIPY